MVSKNNFKNKMEQTAARTPHYGIRKLSVGVASVLISTTLYMGATSAKADTLPSTATDTATTKPEATSSSSSTQANATAGATSSDKSSANNNSLVTNSVESTANTTAQTQPKPDVVTSDKANVDNQVGSNVENKATTTTGTISAPTTPKRVVRSLAAAPTTNSKELVENQDYTVSNVSLEDHKKQDNFDEDATFLHADIKAKNGDVIANKEITFTFNSKEFRGFDNLKKQDLIYNDQVIGNITGVGDWNRVFKVAFNDNTRGFKDINLSLKVYLSNNPYTMRDLYTNNQAKNNEKYTVRHNYQIGSTNYYVDREATIHYVAEQAPKTEKTEADNGTIFYWYPHESWFPTTLTYYTTKDGKTYSKLENIPNNTTYRLEFGKDFITPDTKSVTITFEPSSKWYSQENTAISIHNDHTVLEKISTIKTEYSKSDLLEGTTDLYINPPKKIEKTDSEQTYRVGELKKLDGNTLIATDVKTSTGLNNLVGRTTQNGSSGNDDIDFTINRDPDLVSFVTENLEKILETQGEFLKNNTDFTNPGRIVVHNNTTGQTAYRVLRNNVHVNNRYVTTPPDGAILISAGKDIPTKVYSYTSTDVPSNVDKSKLTKEVTRTINVHNPNGTVDTTVQKVTYHQTVTVAGDEVVYNNDWLTADNQSWDKVDVPQIEGYKASQTTVNQSWVNVNTQNQTADITYTANPQSIKINYVDDEKGGASVKSDTLNGKTDETVKTGITIPENYNVVGTTPSEYTFKANGNTDITVHLKHVIDTTSEEKTVTRTIKVTDPTGKVTTIPQTAKVTRTVSTDKVTNQKTYGDWTTSSFDSYDVPSVEGYTASQDKVDTATVTSDTQNSEVNITYTANDQTIKINYIDSDNNDSVVKSDTLNGKTDQTVKTGITIPEGYTIEEQVPTDYTFKASGNTDITVKLKHVTTTVTPDKPKTANDKLPDNPSKNYPSGVAESDLNKNVTRTIKVTDPQGKVTTETQTVHLTRTATVDEVTGKVSYDDWSTGSFGSYDVPSVDGYTASQVKVDETKVTSDTQNSEVNISYTANNQTAKVVYIDGDNGGSTVKTDILKGKTDETVKTGIKVPDGYVVESNVPTDYTFKSKDNADITVKLKHGTTTVTPDKPKTINDKLPDNPNKTYPEGVAESDLNKDVTRTIKVTDPKGKVTTTTQTVHLTRTATVDEVTGKVTYGDWSTGSFNSYDVPSVEGYTASQGKVDTDKVTSDSTNSEVNISYTANDQTVKVVYVDENNGGSTVKTETLEGKTDQTVKTGIKVPDGYVVDGQVPADYTFKAKNNADITVKLKHGTTTVTADNPKTTADKLPNNPTKSYPDGVGQNDLNKTVTRTIKVTTPDGKTSTTTQTVHLTRTATVDEVTGKVTYSDWTTGSFDSYDVPSVDGYTASQSKVDGTPVTADSSNNEVNISYTANDQSAKIVYVDNGKVVSTQVLTGKTDQTVKTNIQSPDKDKYVVVGNNPENYTFKAKDNEDIRVEVKHVVNTFKDYKNVIRSIEVTYPNGKTEKLDQVATLERTVHKDAVTGEETYSDWSTENWDSFTAPAINGYTADKDVKETVVTGNTTETTVNIVYTANEQATKIVYVDNDKSGSIVKTDTLNGKTDQTVKTDVKVPDGYVLEGNVPDNYTFTAGDNFDIIVHLRHGIVKVTPDKPKTTADKLPDSSKTYPEGVGQDDLNKTITRTIKVTTPNGKTSTTTQTAHLIRTARVDETTGQVTYDDWTTDSFDSYDVPSVDGYTASQAKVEETKVTSDSQDSEVNISYTANKQSIEVVYVDGDNSGSTVKTDTLTGKTDETVKTGIEIPDGYEVDGQVPSEYSFKAKDNADITVHLKHNTVTVIPEKPKTTEDKLPNNPSKSYPKGVAENDLNKTVVRTIKVTTPDGKTTTTKQTVKLNRVAVVDEVTGQVTYSKWSIGELDRYDVPSIEGYTPSQDRVNMEVATSETKDSVVEISYTPNGQSINITYVDDDKGKTTVDSYILAGKTDETVKTGIKIPDGYEVEGQVPTDYTFKAKDNVDITVRLKHKLDKGTETKTVSRIVEITLPDGQTKTIKQEQTLKRSKTTDLVTGDVVYGEWSKGEFDEVVVPEIDGYKPSQAKVESKVVDGASSDQVVKVTYEKIKSEAKPTAEVKNEAKVQVAPTAEAKTSAKPQAKAQPKFVTTELPQTGEKQSKGTTVGAILVGLGSLLGLGALGKRKEK